MWPREYCEEEQVDKVDKTLFYKFMFFPEILEILGCFHEFVLLKFWNSQTVFMNLCF